MFKKSISNTDSILQVNNKEKKWKFKKVLFIILILVAIAGVVAGVYYFRKYQELKQNPNVEAQKETENLVATVGKLMELPKDEAPTVATIADKDKLKDQTFFVKAENGDKLLAYTKAMQAILYRPSTNKIIAVAPIVINQPLPGGEQKKETSEKPNGLKIAYYNGTSVVGLSGQAEKNVKGAYPDYQTGTLGNASKDNYTETLVIDLTGNHSQEAGNIAKLLGGKVGSLPEGEAKPDADILIISGK
jgi:uncharacterized protein YneF (UPF0154 family)